MWSDQHAPTLSLGELSDRLGRPFREVKAAVEARWKRMQAAAEKQELKAAAARHRRGPAKVNEEIGEARPLHMMSRLRFIELYRATLIEKGCQGGELLNDEDFTRFLLKKLPHLRFEMAKAQNRIGWTQPDGTLNVAALPEDTPSLVMAAHHGKMERGELNRRIITAA